MACFFVFALAGITGVCFAEWKEDWIQGNSFGWAADKFYRRGIDVTENGVYIAGTRAAYNQICPFARAQKLNKDTGILEGFIETGETGDCRDYSKSVQLGYDIDAYEDSVYIAAEEYQAKSGLMNSWFNIIKTDSNLNYINNRTINKTSYKETPQAIAADETGVYIVGSSCSMLSSGYPGTNAFNTSDSYWYLVKFDADLNSTLWEKEATHSITTFAEDVAVGSDGIYIVGQHTSSNWRIEKRDKSNGNLMSGFGGGDGVITVSGGKAKGVAVGSTGLYIIGGGDGGRSDEGQRRASEREADDGANRRRAV